MSTKTVNFDELMGMTEDDERAAKVGIAKRSLKRMLASAADDAMRMMMEDETILRNTYSTVRRRAEVEAGQVQHIIETRLHIRKLEVTLEVIKEEYEALFGEPLTVE